MGKLKNKEKLCKNHGLTDFFLDSNGKYRCKICRKEGVQRRRLKVKSILVKEAGGKCKICNYDRCDAALEFHHLNPEEKNFGISHKGITYAIDTLRKETLKCILLCCRCHREVENGLVQI